MNDITISVIIPVYNGKRYIKRCLQSASIQKGCIEIIVVDDNSNDGLKEYLDKIKDSFQIDIRYFRNKENRGAAFSRNIGIIAAKGTHIAFLDVDDWWESNKTEKQLEIIKKGIPFTYTSRRNHYASNGTNKVIHTLPITDFKTLVAKNPITCSSVIMTKELALKNYASGYWICEDFMMWLKIFSTGIVAEGIDEPLVNYTVRKDSSSANKFLHAIKRFITYKKFGFGTMKSFYYAVRYIVIKVYSKLFHKGDIC